MGSLRARRRAAAIHRLNKDDRRLLGEENVTSIGSRTIDSTCGLCLDSSSSPTSGRVAFACRSQASRFTTGEAVPVLQLWGRRGARLEVDAVRLCGWRSVCDRAARRRGAPSPQSVEAVISSWQASIRDSTSPARATEEWITDTRTAKVGKLIRVDVVFQARKRDDPAPREPGLDSLVLVDVDGAWKVLSFVVHYESKL